mgnify:CR=1 FL=1
MIRNIRKSLSAILYERTTSPLYGALIVSWLLWNWKIIYLTFFISENKIHGDKISYITKNFSDIHLLITYPLISTLFILTLIPFLSNAAFLLNLKFEKWKKDKKNLIEKQQLLTLGQSIELREQILNQESKFEKLVENKNREITQLNGVIEKLNIVSPQLEKKPLNKRKQNFNIDEITNKIKLVDGDLKAFQKMLTLIQSGYKITDRADVPSKLITILEVNDMISPTGQGYYGLTTKGKQFTRSLI